MAGTNLAAVLHKKQDLRLEQREIPEPGPNEVQVYMRYNGVCGSDVHLWQEGGIGDTFVVREPLVLGHECSGVVSKLGGGVTHLNVGDRVSIEPHRVCRTCDACCTGRYNMCPNVLFLATPPYDGSLVQYLVHDANFVFKLPANVSLEEGALIEPLSVGLHVCRRARITVGDTVLICGAGPIGICVLLAAQAFGAATTIMTDLSASRLDFAKGLRATYTLQVHREDTVEAVASSIGQLLGGLPNKAIECSGAQFSVNLGIEVLRPGGVLGVLGLGSAHVTIPMVKLVVKEIELIGSVRYIHTWRAALELLASGKVSVKPLVTHRFTLQEVAKAFETARAGEGIKVMVDCNPE